MFNETVCLENLKHIVSEIADDQHIKNLSLDELRSTYTKITENIYRISVFNCHTYKNMLWNFNNLRPEIRSKFQKELFNTWYPVYLKSTKTDMPADHPEGKKQESTIHSEAEDRPEIDALKQTPVIAAEQPIESEKQKIVASSEDTDISLKKGPAIAQSPITSAHKFENDWFDKLLDFFAAITGYLSGVIGR